MKDINIDVIVTKEDYRKANYFNAFKSRGSVITYILATVIMGLTILLKFIEPNSIPDFLFYISIGYFLVMLLLIYSLNVTINKFIKTDNIYLGFNYKYLINSDLISVTKEADGSHLSYEWNSICEAYETKKYFLLYINYLQLMIINKDNIKEENIAEFREIIKCKIDKKFHSRI